MPISEIFISHASADHEFASSLVITLRRHGLPVWYSDSNIVGAQQWHDEIGAALNRCDWFIVVLSPNAVSSMWIKRELLFALEQPRLQQRIIPVLHKPCDSARLSWTLSAMQTIRFSDGFDDGCRDLLRIWGLGYSSL
jgi:hypothetical protein